MYLLVYVDDLILIGNNDCAFTQFTKQFVTKFSIKDLDSLSYFLSVELILFFHGVLLSQCKYMHDLLEKVDMLISKDVHTPMSPNQGLSLHDNIALIVATHYWSFVGDLQYLSLTCPDVAFIINKLSQFMHRPTTQHWSVIKHLLRYLQSGTHHGLFLHWHSQFLLHGFSDANWANNPNDRTSTRAHVTFLGHNTILWSLKKQRIVFHSSIEVECYAIAFIMTEIMWLQSLLYKLGIYLPMIPTIYCDNISATYLCANSVFYSCMKHIALDFHLVWEKMQSGTIQVSHVSSNN